VVQFSEEVRDGTCVVRIAGDLDLAAVDDFVEVGRVSLGRCQGVELDLGGVTFIDSSGLGALVRLHKESDEQGTPLHLTNVTEATERLLELTGLTGVFDIRASRD
jgi:anti-anti-sigma factor